MTELKIALDVVSKWQGELIDCKALAIENTEWQIRNLAFFMSNVYIEQNTTDKNKADQFQLINSNGADASLVRINNETCQGKVLFKSTRSLKAGDEFSFDLGVPFAINHLNPITQPAPLNEPDMFWSWRNGYKFFRLDMMAKGDNWAYHLGSVGCVSDSAVRAPLKACAKPNLTRQTLKVPEGEQRRLVLHLDKLLTHINATKANRCVMHGDKEPACAVLFQNLNNVALNIFTLEHF